MVASKVYYHLQEYNESMVLALGAGKLFKLDNGGEYEETIIGKFNKLASAASPGRSLTIVRVQPNASILSSPYPPPSDPLPVTRLPT